MATLTFWGVQGSCAGNNNNDYGSNTSCISIEINKQLIILDSGTGIRTLAEQLNPSDYDQISIILTHAHWDHIQGFPFFWIFKYTAIIGYLYTREKPF